MRLAYNQATCRKKSSLEGDLELCERHGIPEIELRFDMLEQYLQSHTERELAALFLKSPVKPITLNAIFDINDRSVSQWAEIEAKFRFACRIGELLDVHCVIALPSPLEGGLPPAREKIAEDCVRSLARLAALGRPHGMRIAFEPVGTRCVGGIRDAWEIVRAANDPDIGLAVDAYNLYQHRGLKDIADISLVNPGKIFIVHLDDADKGLPYDRLGTFDRVLPGDGAIDLPAFVRAVDATGYAGAYSIEILNQGYWEREPESLFAEACEKTRRLLALCERKNPSC
ncbi:MAG: sugar phosphate isomerase/epimerase [Clostridiales bacterium]|nr:sugar phosphate isomerase/epimerase [Clostridiales bacterium]